MSISTNQPSIVFDISQYPEVPSELNQFNNAMNVFNTDVSKPASTLQAPIDSLNIKINNLKSIENSYKEFIERYNSDAIKNNEQEVSTKENILKNANMQLEVQKENLNNMTNRLSAAQTNVGFMMFKPLGPSTYRILQIVTILFGIAIIYMIVKISYGPTYANPIDNKVRQTVAQVIAPTEQTGGGILKKVKPIYKVAKFITKLFIE
jgi:cytochrome c556